MPIPLILYYYSGLALRVSTDDTTCVWGIELTEHVFMACALFLINARYDACLRYYMLNILFDSLTAGVLCRLSDKVLDSLRYYSS